MPLIYKNETFDITMAGGSLHGRMGALVSAAVGLFRNSRFNGILRISAIDLDGSLLDGMITWGSSG